MARKKSSDNNGKALFDVSEQHHDRRNRRQRALFIPRFLTEAAAKQQLTGESQDKAYEIAIRWADRETNGQLNQDKETTIDTQFLDQLFGEGLGYRVKTKSPDAWELGHKIPVAGVGIADGPWGPSRNRESH